MVKALNNSALRCRAQPHCRDRSGLEDDINHLLADAVDLLDGEQEVGQKRMTSLTDFSRTGDLVESAS